MKTKRIQQAKQIKKSQSAKLKKRSAHCHCVDIWIAEQQIANTAPHMINRCVYVCVSVALLFGTASSGPLVSHSSNSIICFCLGKQSDTPQPFCERFYLFIQIAAQIPSHIHTHTHTQWSCSSHNTQIFNPAHISFILARGVSASLERFPCEDPEGCCAPAGVREKMRVCVCLCAHLLCIVRLTICSPIYSTLWPCIVCEVELRSI